MEAVEVTQDSNPPVKRAKRLTPQESATLKRQEAIIERGLRTFYSVGEALNVIRSQRLYRAKFPNFRAYCQTRWGFGINRAHQLITAAEAYHDIAPTATTAPSNEGQLRPLATIDKQLRIEVWKKAETMGPITERTIKQAITEVVPSEQLSGPEVEQRDSDIRAIVEELSRRYGQLSTFWFALGDAPLTPEVHTQLKSLCRKLIDATRDVIGML